jgi:DNA mismatch repair protein MLH1
MIRDLYSRFLVKGKHPFVYLSLVMKAENVDVNVHPTKNVVRFRHEDQILAKVISVLEEKLKVSIVLFGFVLVLKKKQQNSKTRLWM